MPARAGVIVNEIQSEVSVATTTTSANSERNCPTVPGRNAIGKKDDDVDERDHDGGGADLRPPFDRRFTRRLAVIVVPLDVFEHDDRIVDQDPDDQRHRKQRDRVDREVDGFHRRQRQE